MHIQPLLYAASLLVGCVPDDDPHCFKLDDVRKGEDVENLKLLSVKAEKEGQLAPVEKDVFRRFASLTVLHLRDLNSVEPGFLDGLDKLIDVVIQDSQVDEIKPYTFANTPIGSVTISRSHLKEIHPHAFNNTPNLEDVWIYRNNIPTIKRGVFNYTNIKILYLQTNNLQDIEEGALIGMKNLKYLYLDDNKLTSFSSRKILGHKNQIKTLNLARNKLTKLTKDMFDVLPNLKVVNVSNNAIRGIEEETFESLRIVECIDLSKNSIKVLRADIFQSASTVNLLYLHNNLFSYIAPEVLSKLPLLTDLSLANNPWQCGCLKMVEQWASQRNVTDFCQQQSKSDRYCVSLPDNKHECQYSKQHSTFALEEYEKNHKFIWCYPEYEKS